MSPYVQRRSPLFPAGSVGLLVLGLIVALLLIGFVALVVRP